MIELEIVILVLFIVLILISIVMGFLWYKNIKNKKDITSDSNDPNNNFISMGTKIECLSNDNRALNNSIISKMANIDGKLDQISNSTQFINEMNNRISSINDIFLNVKNRGNFGEFQLETILKDIYGVNNELLKFQHEFINDNQRMKIDATIRIDDKYIAIDSKFPMDNFKKWSNSSQSKEESEINLKVFKQDIKNKVNEVKKYISEKNGISFVILFIPSEKIYTTIAEEFPDIISNSSKEKIYFASPTTLVALMNIIVANAKEFSIINKGKETLQSIKEIIEEFNKWNNQWMAFIKELSTLYNKVKDMNIKENKIYTKMKSISPENKEFYQEQIDKNRNTLSEVELTSNLSND